MRKLHLVLCVSAMAIVYAFQSDAKSARLSKESNVLENSRRDFLHMGATGVVAAVAGPRTTNAVGRTIVYGNESIMAPKAHGTSETPVQQDLLYGVSNQLADRICNYNRHFAEFSGYFESTSWKSDILQAKEPITFYDSVTGKPLFVGPLGRTAEDLVKESEVHGWPSFRDSEVVWDNVRVLRNGETVSIDGTHLGTSHSSSKHVTIVKVLIILKS